jgi:predicted ribosome quality control (RQC) complex YloA/Tae2 family protein
MARSERKAPPPPDPENGVWQGRSVARRFVSPDGLTVLVGRTAEDNDVLTFKLGSPRDFWFHLAGDSGSHVVVRNPEGLDRLPKETEQFAASLAAGYSKGKKGGRVSVHICRCEDVSKPRGLPPGKVLLDRYKSVQVSPWRPDMGQSE